MRGEAQSGAAQKQQGIDFLDGEPARVVWPLQDIAITNIVWCMAYTRGVGRGAYIAQ